MWYPDAIAKPIPPGANDPRIIPVGLIYHVRDGLGDSLYPYFSGPSGGIESHWYIRFDGTIEQYRDTEREADANLDGNSWRGSDGRLYGLHSVETEGLEHGEWTGAQITSLKELTVWDAREHDWSLQLIPRWNGKGVGYHVMFGAPGPYTDVAKTCPGPARVRQFKQIIVPWLESGGDDMPTAKEIADEILNVILPKVDETSGSGPRMRVKNFLRWIHEHSAKSRGSIEQTIIPQIAAIRSEQAANRELLVQLAAQHSGVQLSEEQVHELAQRIAEAGQGACDQVLDRLALAGAALVDGDEA